ncbi:MAG: hypothetical protein AAFN41_14270 [Planctomycetota bacterium]
MTPALKTACVAAVFWTSWSAAAQDLNILCAFTRFNTWDITAEFRGVAPSPLVMAWADASFVLTGRNISIGIPDYNPAYDTSLGDAIITGNGTDRVSFVGNANEFFGTTDSSNPLFVARVTADFITGFELVGQNSAIFESPPFGDVRLYQDAQGNPGDLTFAVSIIFPAPASTGLLALGGLVSARRRR